MRVLRVVMYFSKKRSANYNLLRHLLHGIPLQAHGVPFPRWVDFMCDFLSSLQVYHERVNGNTYQATFTNNFLSPFGP